MLTKATKKQVYQETAMAEWLFVATVIDKCLLIFFTCCNAVFIGLLLFYRPADRTDTPTVNHDVTNFGP